MEAVDELRPQESEQHVSTSEDYCSDFQERKKQANQADRDSGRRGSEYQPKSPEYWNNTQRDLGPPFEPRRSTGGDPGDRKNDERSNSETAENNCQHANNGK